MPRRKHTTSTPRTVPMDVVVIGFVAMVLWSQWPTAPTPRHGTARTLSRRPAVAFVKADLATCARDLLFEAPLQPMHNRGRVPKPSALPGWSDVEPSEPPPEPAPMAAALPAATPLRLPILPDPESSGLRDATSPSLPQPFEAPSWILDLADELSGTGVRLDEAALLAASRQASPSGECAANLVLGPDGLPESALLDPDAAAPFAAEARTAMARALLLARAPAGTERLAGRVRWRWKSEVTEPESAASETGAAEPSP